MLSAARATERALRRAHRAATIATVLMGTVSLLLYVIAVVHDGLTTVPLASVGATGQLVAALVLATVRWLIGKAIAWHRLEMQMSDPHRPRR